MRDREGFPRDTQGTTTIVEFCEYDRESSRPIEGATVRILATGEEKTTDENGKARFMLVSGKVYGWKVIPNRPGYKEKTGRVRAEGPLTRVLVPLERLPGVPPPPPPPDAPR